MHIVINGEQKQLDVQTIYDVIQHYDLQDKQVVAEADGVILSPERWKETAVQDGMKIELVHFVGGG